MGWGANNAGNVLVYGEWWRLVTSMFVHGGLLHLGLNMWCLWNLGMLAEPLMGTLGVFAVYLLTGAAGNMLSTFFNWINFRHNLPLVQFASDAFPAGVGASGAIFGIAGALIVLLKSQRLPVPPEELKKIRRSVIYFAAINLFIGFSLNFGSSRYGRRRWRSTTWPIWADARRGCCLPCRWCRGSDRRARRSMGG